MEMDPLVTAALVGTAQRGSPPADSSAPVDSLARAFPPFDAERALLLRAGCAAVYAEAGVMPDALPDVSEPAPDERLHPCPPAAATLLWKLFDNAGEHRDALLLEAFERMRQAGMSLPHDLLPTALYLRPPNLRTAVAPLAGERGRWLSHLNPDWSWLADELGERASDDMPSDETLWQEGTTSQRVAVLRRLRASAPAAAREWLAAIWKRERAEVRADLLRAFEEGLTMDDEPFLENALDDRSVAVRSLAASLLAQVPGSALATRMRKRADALLSFAADTLVIAPPKSLDGDALRDGIPEKLATHNKRASWLSHILALVPLSHWQERFQASPDYIITALESSEWQATVMEGLGRSALTFGAGAWAMPLWTFWRDQTAKRGPALYEFASTLRDTLGRLIPPLDAEAYVRTLVADVTVSGSANWEDVVTALPKPWSADFGAFYVTALRTFVAGFSEQHHNFTSWSATIPRAVHALPPTCFAAALAPFEPLQDKSWQAQQFNRQLDTFTDTIRLRQRIQEVFPL